MAMSKQWNTPHLMNKTDCEEIYYAVNGYERAAVTKGSDRESRQWRAHLRNLQRMIGVDGRALFELVTEYRALRAAVIDSVDDLERIARRSGAGPDRRLAELLKLLAIGKYWCGECRAVCPAAIVPRKKPHAPQYRCGQCGSKVGDWKQKILFNAEGK